MTGQRQRFSDQGANAAAQIRALLPHLFGTDLRSLGAMRIGIAFCILVDLALRSTALRDHYTDFGVLPRAAILSDGRPLHFNLPSLHILGGSWEFQALLFSISAVLALLLLVGYRTRIVTVLCWVMLVSLQHRTPILTHGPDLVLACIMFFAMFMPWGRRFSLDARRQRPMRGSGTELSIASAGYTLQIALSYLFGALHKTGPEWRSDGTALYYALGAEGLVRPLGEFLWQFDGLMTLATWGTMVLEFCGPFLLFFPYRTASFRSATLAAIVSFQVFIWLSLAIGLFPMVNIVALIGLIPGSVCERLAPGTASAPPVGEEPSSALGRGAQAIPGVAIVFIILFNLSTLDPPLVRIPADLERLGTLVRLEQSWIMFAPAPYKDGGWFVLPGRLANGRRVDLFRKGADVSWEKPERIYAMYPTYRWRKFLRIAITNETPIYLDLYAQYLCRDWNERHQGGEAVESLQIVYVLERTLPDHKRADPRRISLWRHHCGEGGVPGA